MSKRRNISSAQLLSYNVRKFIDEFPDLRYNGSQLMCLVCKRSLLAFKKSLCVRHVNSAAHKLKKNGRNFILDLIFMLCTCNVPFSILNKEVFRRLWTKYNATLKLPSRTTLQTYLPAVREKIEKLITYQTRNQKLWLSVGEITDSKKRSVANVIIRTLDSQRPSSAYLLASKRLKNYTSESIQDLILTTLKTFQISTHQVIVFLSDDTSIMLSTGRFLKTASPDLMHVTCILDSLRLVTEMVRICYPDVDALITRISEALLKSPKCAREFHNWCPDIPEPPRPILTQWGIWLNAAFYYSQHFQRIKHLFLQFDAEESAAVRESQIKLLDARIEGDLKSIRCNYAVLADALKKLQNNSICLGESLQIVADVQNVLRTSSRKEGIYVRTEFDGILRKNPDFARLKRIYSDNDETDPLYKFRDLLKYVNITSLDTKRSFSFYKNIFSPNRRSLTEMTLETYAMLQMFSQSNPGFSF